MFCAGRRRRDAGHPAQSWETRPSKVLAQPRTQHCPRTAKAKEKGSGDKLSLKKCCSPQSHSSLVFPECSQVPFGALLLGKRAFKGNPTFSIHNLSTSALCDVPSTVLSSRHRNGAVPLILLPSRSQPFHRHVLQLQPADVVHTQLLAACC